VYKVLKPSDVAFAQGTSIFEFKFQRWLPVGKTHTHVWYVLSGNIQLRRKKDDKNQTNQIVRIVGKGECYGCLEMIAEKKLHLMSGTKHYYFK
jgi:CRP-like cAMP-binding protein